MRLIKPASKIAYISLAEAAARLSCSAKTMRRWIKLYGMGPEQGVIRLPSGVYRIDWNSFAAGLNRKAAA